MLGRSNPVGVLWAGILFGALRAGGREMQGVAGVPIDPVIVIQALIIVFIAAPAVIRAIYRLPCIKSLVDQIIFGVVINIFALGLTSFLDHSLFVYGVFILVIAVDLGLFYTRWGLRSRSVGEHPEATDTLGIDVYKTRYRNVIFGGMIAGFGGAFITLSQVSRASSASSAPPSPPSSWR